MNKINDALEKKSFNSEDNKNNKNSKNSKNNKTSKNNINHMINNFSANFNSIKSNILDVYTNEVYAAEIIIENGFIFSVNKLNDDFDLEDLDFEGILVPGFIDAHIHIESSFLTPSNFAKAVVPFGTTSVIADPHEIANVLGIEGIEFMINDASTVPFDFYFSAPSYVPSTEFETSGACIDSVAIDKLMEKEEIVSLGEVMNFFGVINKDEDIIKKLKIAKKYNKPIDGHAPMLTGEKLQKYVNFGESFDTNSSFASISSNSYDTNELSHASYISTDHECTSFDEAIEKKKNGMKIMVREGSSAKNMRALFNISDRIELCTNQDFFGSVSVDDFNNVLKNPIFDFLVSDDKDLEDLKKGHLNLLIKKSADFGIDPVEAIKMVTINPSEHYKLNSGVIARGKRANFVLIDNLEDLNIKKTIIGGKTVAENGKSFIKTQKPHLKNTFNVSEKIANDFNIYTKKYISSTYVKVIEALNGEIITNVIESELKVENKIIKENINEDILKLAAVERYGHNNVSNAFIKGFNLKKGAIASSVSHDSHNIIVVGTNNEDMVKATNLISKNQGGLAVVGESTEKILKLPIAGLMSDGDLDSTLKSFKEINEIVSEFGCNLSSPFMTLSFMSLLVIPSLRLSDKGLFDVDNFEFTNLLINFFN